MVMSGTMDLIFNVICILALIVIAVVIVRIIVKGQKDKASPKLTVKAKVVAKSIQETRTNGVNVDLDMCGFVTFRHVAFEVEGGDVLEFNVEDGEYKMLTEGDQGDLTFQGSKYLGFHKAV